MRRLVEALKPRAIYLFGSHAGGRPHAHSDIDVLVVVDDDADVKEQDRRARVSLWEIGVPIDLVVLRQSSVNEWAGVKYSLPYEATQNGTLLYAA